MGKCLDMIFGFSTEELRQELCIEADYKLILLRRSQILDKLNDIKAMLNKQVEIHKEWQ